jgi:hypothetical protein
VLILEPHKVLIQSPVGQQWIREKHKRVVGTLDAYPMLRKELWPDAELDRLLPQLLAGTGSLATLTYPAFYIEAEMLGECGIPADYLKRADTALGFLVRKAPKRNFRDLIGNLRGGVPAAGIFEVMLVWALTAHFGESAVEPYPVIAPGSKRTVDFAVASGGRRVLLEAMVLLNDRESGLQQCFCFERGICSTFELSGDEDYCHRLEVACKSKAQQRKVIDPLIVCVDQEATWPDPRKGMLVAGQVVAWADQSSASMLIGVAYCYGGHCGRLCSSTARSTALGVSPQFLLDLNGAFMRMCP